MRRSGGRKGGAVGRLEGYAEMTFEQIGAVLNIRAKCAERDCARAIKKIRSIPEAERAWREYLAQGAEERAPIEE